MYAIKVTLTDGREGWYGDNAVSEHRYEVMFAGPNQKPRILTEAEYAEYGADMPRFVGGMHNVASARVVLVELREVGT